MIKHLHSRKRTLWILIIIFSLPLWVSYYLSHHLSWLKSLQTTNYGTWVKPSFTWHLEKQNSRPWHLVLWSPKACDASCFATLNQLGKVRLAMGRKLYLLNIGLVLPRSQALSSAQMMDCQAQDIQVSYIDDENIANWRSNFDSHPIVLFAPLEQALLMYPLSLDSKKLYHDLQQLIK